jgi:hypothetical protein
VLASGATARTGRSTTEAQQGCGAQEVLAAVRHPVRTESSSGVARAWLMTGAVLRERGQGQARHG